jgi:hypothetical protein
MATRASLCVLLLLASPALVLGNPPVGIPVPEASGKTARQQVAEFLAGHSSSRFGERPGEPLCPADRGCGEEILRPIVQRAAEQGLSLTLAQAAAAAPHLRAGDSLDEQVEVVRATAVHFGACAAAGAAFGFSVEMGRLIGYHLRGQSGPAAPSGLTVLEETAKGAVCGLLTCGLFPQLKVAHAGLGLSPLGREVLDQVIDGLGEEVVFSHLCDAAWDLIKESLVYQEFSGGCYREIHGIKHYTAAGTETWTRDCIGPAVYDAFQFEVIDIQTHVAGTAFAADPVLPIGFAFKDGVYFNSLLSPQDTLTLAYSVLPTVAGTYQIQVGVTSQGIDHLLRTETITISPAQVGSILDFSATFTAAELLALAPGTSPELRFYLESNGFSGRFRGGREGADLLTIDTADLPPVAVLDARANGAVVRFFGSYLDVDHDAATLLTLQLDGPAGRQNFDLLPFLETGDPASQLDFSRTLTLPNGSYTYRLLVSDATTGSPAESSPSLTGQRASQVGDFRLRVSSTPPSVDLQLSSGSAAVGQAVGATVQLVDAAGPVPFAEIGLARSLRGTFRDPAGHKVRSLQTSAAGTATFSYEPSISGRHTLLAMEPTYRYAWRDLEVSGNPDAWTFQWSWTVVANDDGEATYDCQVLILFQGAPLDPGDVVIFSANHGSFQDASDQLGGSGFAQNRYTIRRNEAEAGDEVFRLGLPAYGVELVFVTNLTVGSPAALPRVGAEALQAVNQDNWAFGVAFSADGRFAARALGESVVIYRLPDLTVVRTVDLDGDDLMSVDFSPDGDRLATVDADGYLSLVDVASGAVVQRNVTDGATALQSVDWYDTGRIAVGTDGNASRGFLPRVLVLDGGLNVLLTKTFSGLGHDDEIVRVRCNAPTARCAMASFTPSFRWAVFSATSGAVLGQGVHPDIEPLHAIAWSEPGDRFLVAGEEDAGGALYAKLFAVSGAGLSPLPDPLSANQYTYAAAFVRDAMGVERLALGGDQRLEIFSRDGGPVLLDAPDEVHGAQQSYYLAFLNGTSQLAAVNNTQQVFYSLSGDAFGPTLRLPQLPPLPFGRTTVTVSGAVEDPAGLRLTQYRRNDEAWQDLPVDGAGNFALAVDGLPLGSTVLTVRSWDLHHNRGEQSVTLLRLDDLDPPLISQATVTPGAARKGTLFRIAARIADTDSGVAGARAEIRHAAGGLVATLPLVRSVGDLFQADFDSSAYPVGRYSIDVSAEDLHQAPNGRTLVDAARFSFSTFADVPADHWAWRWIEGLAAAGVTGGCGNGNYCPDSNVTREQMAVFLLISKEGAGHLPPPCTSPTFEDVPCTSAFARWIEELVRREVTAGCGGVPPRYCPTSRVSREQMAVFLLRTFEGPAYAPPICQVPRFADVPCTSPFARWIEELVRRGVTAGCGGGNFCPAGRVTRAQMAVFLATTFALPVP